LPAPIVKCGRDSF